MEFADLLQVLPKQAIPPMQSGGHPALPQPPEYVGFVAPPLRHIGGDIGTSPFVLISAPGVVGKTTLATYVAAGRAAALWDLSRLTLGDNTFLGTLVNVFGAAQFPSVLDAATTGRTFVFDAFDEAEILSGWDRVERFVRETWAYLANAATVSAILLARSETAALLDVLLRDLAGDKPRHTVLEIDFFDESSAKRFVEKQLANVHDVTTHLQHREPFVRALDELFTVLADVLPGRAGDPWEEPVCRSFLGYAPVLQALAAYLAQFQNYQDVIAELKPAQIGQTQSDILSALMQDLLSRERDKFIGAIRSRPRPSATPEPNWGALYRPSEQLGRVFSFMVSDEDAFRPPQGLSSWANDIYAEALNSFLPNHPFLRGRNFAGPASQDYVYAELLSDEDVAPLVESWLEGATHAPTPLLAPFYVRASKGFGQGSHAGFLYESAAAAFGLDSTAVAALVNPEGVEGMHLMTVLSTGDDVRDSGFEINLHVDTNRPLVFRQRLRNAALTVEGPVALVANAQFEVANVEMQCTTLEINSPVLSVRTAAGQRATLIQSATAPSINARLKIDVREPATLQVNWPDSARFPWADHSNDDLFDEGRDRSGAFVAIRRILRWFRKDRRQSLARYKHLIDNVVVGNSALRAQMLQFLLKKGILTEDGKFYSLHGEAANRLGISWSALSATEPPQAVIPLLDEFLA